VWGRVKGVKEMKRGKGVEKGGNVHYIIHERLRIF